MMYQVTEIATGVPVKLGDAVIDNDGCAALFLGCRMEIH